MDSRRVPPASRLPMRNWNTNWRTILPWRQRRFQTTYEELKPLGDIGEGPTVEKASRLPMRNWNTSFGTKRITRNTLPDYLWGIETRICREVFLSFPASRLPMRNWNAIRHQKCIYHLASRLPMRNWNAIRHQKCIYHLASRLPMRNWNVKR